MEGHPQTSRCRHHCPGSVQCHRGHWNHPSVRKGTGRIHLGAMGSAPSGVQCAALWGCAAVRQTHQLGEVAYWWGQPQPLAQSRGRWTGTRGLSRTHLRRERAARGRELAANRRHGAHLHPGQHRLWMVVRNHSRFRPQALPRAQGAVSRQQQCWRLCDFEIKK